MFSKRHRVTDIAWSGVIDNKGLITGEPRYTRSLTFRTEDGTVHAVHMTADDPATLKAPRCLPSWYTEALLKTQEGTELYNGHSIPEIQKTYDHVMGGDAHATATKLADAIRYLRSIADRKNGSPRKSH